jgi:hypothetical protein
MATSAAKFPIGTAVRWFNEHLQSEQGGTVLAFGRFFGGCYDVYEVEIDGKRFYVHPDRVYVSEQVCVCGRVMMAGEIGRCGICLKAAAEIAGHLFHNLGGAL